MDMRTGFRRAAIASIAIVAVASAALADDSGVHDFLLSGSSASERSAPVAPAAAPVREGAQRERPVSYRPLVIRRKTPRVVVAVGPTKPAKVSIFEDRTLRPGDAVMMADGIRIFAGSRSWPYAKSDFVGLDKAHDLSRETVKVLAELNTLPRS